MATGTTSTSPRGPSAPLRVAEVHRNVSCGAYQVRRERMDIMLLPEVGARIALEALGFIYILWRFYSHVCSFDESSLSR
jgi:hypothetical protein